MRLEWFRDYWTASGWGPLRKIIAEGTTRREAALAFLETFEAQQWEEDQCG